MKHCHKPITDFTNLVQFDSRSQVPKHSVYISHSVISSGYTEAHKFQKKMQNKWRHLKNDNTDSFLNQRESEKDTQYFSFLPKDERVLPNTKMLVSVTADVRILLRGFSVVEKYDL